MERLTSRNPLTESEAMNLSLTDLYMRLKAYEDAEEQGRLVVLPEKTPDIDFLRIFDLVLADSEGRALILPCKVGDTVWGVVFDTRECPNCIGAGGCVGCSSANPIDVYRTEFTLDMYKKIGKTLFLTREEAEKALEGMG